MLNVFKYQIIYIVIKVNFLSYIWWFNYQRYIWVKNHIFLQFFLRIGQSTRSVFYNLETGPCGYRNWIQTIVKWIVLHDSNEHRDQFIPRALIPQLTLNKNKIEILFKPKYLCLWIKIFPNIIHFIFSRYLNIWPTIHKKRFKI